MVTLAIVMNHVILYSQHCADVVTCFCMFTGGICISPIGCRELSCDEPSRSWVSADLRLQHRAC